MNTVNHTQLQRETKKILDCVSKNKETIIVHRSKIEDVVMMPISEWNEMNEMQHLYSTEANRENIKLAFNELKNSNTVKYDSLDEMMKDEN